MDAPLLLALARAKHRSGCNAVEQVLVGRHFVALSWVPKREEAFAKHGWSWVFLLAPQPELWLLHDKDEAFLSLKSRALPDQTRRWGLELKGAHLESVEGDPRERWLGLRFQRRALTGRMEQTRLSFQAIPGRGGLRLDGTDVLTQVRLGLGSPFPFDPPKAEGEPPPLRRWLEHWGEQSEAALHGDVFDILPGEGNLLARHHAWSLERAKKLLLDPRRANFERKLREERSRLDRYGEALAQDRSRHERQLSLRAKATGISAELYRLKGATLKVELLDGTAVELPEGVRAEDAVQKWFTAVKRAERGLERVAHLEKDRQRQLKDLAKRDAEFAEGKLQDAEKKEFSNKSNIQHKGNKRMEKEKKSADKRADGKGRAYRSVMIEGFEVLIGKGDADNDALTFKVANPCDFWLHVASMPGSHVIIRNPDKLSDIPREVIERAAQLAAFFSKARDGGKVEVHWCRVADVSKPRGFEPGKVLLKSYKSVRVYPKE
jgi:hypothetical protein